MKKVTLENVDAMLSAVGCKAQHEPRGQGWHRVSITVPQPDGVALSIGRVMFKDGEYQHVKWYCPPCTGDIQETDIFWFRWHLLATWGVILFDQEWDTLVEEAKVKAVTDHVQAVADRRALNEARRACGKKPRSKALAQPNQRSAARHILAQRLTKHLGFKVGVYAW